MSTPPEHGIALSRRWPGVVAGLLMLAGVLATYRSPKLPEGEWRLFGLDYMMLHQRRIDFALQSLREHGTIAAWYPREFLGTPFWSNVQSFPLLPTRLGLLPTGPENLFTLAVWFSGMVSAGFTYLLARRWGMGVVGAAVSGWTFVCGGYFASRTLAGQLGMLETYWALPVVLYVIERLSSASAARSAGGWMAALGLVCGALSVGAHPQHPVYAVAAGGCYVLWRCRPWRRAGWAIASMLAGVACFGAQLVPMALLVARSTRVLKLGDPGNDIEMPYDRLLSMLRPWRDGAPDFVHRPPGVGDPTGIYGQQLAYFWDTVNYLGVLPIVAAVGLLLWALWTRRRPTWPAVFVLVSAVVALVLSLPVAREVLPASPFIILRSPARLMYFVNFALALGFGATLHRLLSLPPRWKPIGILLVAGALGWHGFDVHRHARAYVHAWRGPINEPEFDRRVVQYVGDGRVAFDKHLDFPSNRRVDDVGFFDSIMLANVYRAMIDLNPGLPQDVNLQEIDGGQMSRRALLAAGVKLVVTTIVRGDAPPAAEYGGLRVYELRDPVPRVSFVPANAVERHSYEQTRQRLRDRSFDVRAAMMLPSADATETRPSTERVGRAPTTIPSAVTLAWTRPRPDRIVIAFDAPGDGYVRLVESHDAGWRARVNGRPARIEQANNMVMAVAVPPGPVRVELEFFTPGAWAGRAVSMLGVGALLTIILCYPVLAERRERDRAES